MSYQALYRTYRPQTFEEVVGQKYIVTTLQNAVKQNKVAHAYLFCGPRGTGKTTVARLLAKAVNCENPDKIPCDECESCKMIAAGTHPDIVEIDGASYGKVETTRDLIEKVKYAPLQGKYKVYIIDEVHMLSDSAFNALLKTLEEPPRHAIFVLATTDPQKVLPTIISRCQRYDFTKVDSEDIYDRLKLILQKENIPCEEEAARVISTLAEGGLRDALSILDQVIAYTPNGIKATDVYEVYGIATPQDKFELLQSAIKKDSINLLNITNKLFSSGMDIKRLTTDLIEILKDCVVFSYTKDKKLLRSIQPDNAKIILDSKNSTQLLKMIDVLLEALSNYRISSNVNSTFEIAMLKLVGINDVVESQNVSRETKIEKQIKEPKVEKPKKTKSVTEPLKTKERNFDNEYLLSLLVAGDKNKKEAMLEKWKKISDYCSDERFARVANQLRNSTIGALNDGFAIVITNNGSSADLINESSNTKDLKDFIKIILDNHYKIYAISNVEFMTLTEEFKLRRTNGTLPSPAIIEKEEKVETENDQTTLALNGLFGSENFEVIE